MRPSERAGRRPQTPASPGTETSVPPGGGRHDGTQRGPQGPRADASPSLLGGRAGQAAAPPGERRAHLFLTSLGGECALLSSRAALLAAGAFVRRDAEPAPAAAAGRLSSSDSCPPLRYLLSQTRGPRASCSAPLLPSPPRQPGCGHASRKSRAGAALLLSEALMNSGRGEAKCSPSLVLANPKYSRLASHGRNVFSVTQSGLAVPEAGTHSVTPGSRNALGQRRAPGPLAATGPRSGGTTQEPRPAGEV